MKGPEIERGGDESSRQGGSVPGRSGLPPDDRGDSCGPSCPACPVCGGPLVEQRGKLICSRCRTICETCCEGGRG